MFITAPTALPKKVPRGNFGPVFFHPAQLVETDRDEKV